MSFVLYFFCGISFLAYLSSGISPVYGVFWAFLSWSIPFWGILQLILFVGLLLRLPYTQDRKYARKSCLLVGFLNILYLPFGWATYQPFGTNTLPTHLPKEAFSVLSYNVRVFNSYSLLEAEKPNSSHTLPAWAGRQDATIQCLQEFYHLEGSPKFDMIRKLGLARGYHYHTGAPENITDSTGFFGLAIFSKLPIVRKGELPFKLPHKDYRLAIWADVLHEHDTIRILNVHLEPFVLNGSTNLAYLLPALARGFAERAKQTMHICNFIAQTPHKIIVAGDFNDLPYSYTYQAIKRQLSNAFEAKGAGLGFTHRGIRGMGVGLRIDNQFYSQGLTCLAYHTYHEQTDSDHLPILGIYKK